MQLSSISLAITRLTGGGLFAGSALALDFTSGNNTLDPRITFSRTTNATVTGSNGLVQYAPHNLLTYSEQFDNAAWVKGLTTVAANATVAPDGSSTADALIETATTGAHQLYRLPGLGVATYTYTVYAKANGRTQFVVQQESGGDSRFTLSGSGTALALGTNTVSIIALANGWYRCSTTFTVTGAFGIYTTLYNGATTSYTGDGVSGIYIWGAQLELGSTATTYNPTTAKNLLGYTEHFDNAAWTKGNSFVQTNLLTYSTTYGGTWQSNGGDTVTQNSISAPDGTVSATKVTLASGVANNRYLTGTAITANGTYTASMYLKAGAGAAFQAVIVYGTSGSYRAWLNTATGAVTGGVLSGTYTNGSMTSTSVGDGWWRVALTVTTATDTTVTVETDQSSVSGGYNSAVGDYFYLWGAQLVQGTSAGDYKATYAAAAAVGYTDIYGQPFAQKLVEDTANSTHSINVSALPVGSLVTASFYAKAAERSQFYINEAGVNAAFFDLSSGSVISQTNCSASIVFMSNGWYRCSWTKVAAYASLRIGSAVGGSNIYTGNGTSGIYIFGAQLSDSASVDPYVYQPVAAPSAVAYYGPRFDYDPVTLAPKGLLIEEQRTNLLTYSEQFDNAAWVKAGSSVASNAAISPDGTSNADKLVEDTSTSEHKVTQNATLVSGTTYAFSFYAKSAGRTAVGFYGAGGMASLTGSVDLSTGSVLSGTITVQNVGNGWWRITGFGASTFTGVNSITVRTLAGSASYTGDGTSGIYIWGAQLEAGAFATSYIPTVASQVTRAADSASIIGNNFARWYNGNTNTFYTEVSYYGQLIGSATETNGIYLNDGTALNQVAVRTVRDLTAPQADVVVVSASSTQLDSAGLVPVLANTVYRRAFAYATNSAQNCINGALDGSTTTSFVLPTSINRLSIPGTFTAMYIKRIAYYNRRLSNTELQGITA